MFIQKIKFQIFTLSAIILFFGFSMLASAATLYIGPETISTGVGDEFTLSVSVDTEDTAVNAADVILQFPNDILEVTDIDRTGSVFAFWITDPQYSNEEGTISFIGGSAKGLSGESLHVLSVTFKTLDVGAGAVTPISSIVTASDGKGTNVLTESFGTSITSGSSVFVPEPVFNPEAVVVEAPKEIVREAVVATDLPDAPSVRVPLYPDQSKWYSHRSEVTTLWEVPNDITKVAIAVDQNPNTEPPKAENILVNGKQLGLFEDGTTFVHVQFKNSKGWGEVAHYKVSIDSEPPLPFEVTTTSRVSDNPTPVLDFDTQDALSGISHTLIFVDTEGVVRTASTTETVGPLKPGTHSITVQVFDYAGNSVEDSIDIETLALPTPIISFVTRSVSLGEALFVTGSSIPNGFVDVSIRDKKNGQEVAKEITETSTNGSWETSVVENFKTGTYQVVATARDTRGAISYPTEPQDTRVRSKVIFSLGVIEFGWFEIFLVTVLLILVVVGVAAWRYISEQSLRGAYVTIVIRDIKKFSKLFENHIKALEKQLRSKKNKFNKQSKGEIDYEVEQMKDTTAKMDKYLTGQTKKIR